MDLEPGIGTVQTKGSVTITPKQTTTYTLAVTGSGGTSKASVTVTVGSSQPEGVQLSPGDDIQSAVNANPTGTTFLLAPGIYRLQSVVPKDNDVFFGQSGAILDGAILISSWRQQSSSVWSAQVSGITQEGSYRGVCDSSHPACIYPEDLFFDSKPLTRVASLSLVAPGSWYFDYSTEKVYAGTNPAGHVTEISALRSAFSGPASNVTIQDLVIEKYASIAGYGAVAGQGSSGWVISNSELCLNHGMGLRVGSSMQVLDNKFHDNGQMGLGGSGSNIVVDSNEIYRNNYAGYDWGWEAGGTKFTFTTGLVVRNNFVHNNDGPGLWTDIDNQDTLYEGNRTSENKVAGIIHEISYHAVIENNLIENDGYSPNGTSFWYGGGILVSNSSDVEIYSNTVTDCMNGIGGIQADRGTDPNTGLPYTLQNLNIHNNIITQQTGDAAGIVKASTFDDSVYTSWGNHLQDNTYNLSDLTYLYFYWLDQNWTFTQWQTYASEH
jgi:Right handed beta helix region